MGFPQRVEEQPFGRWSSERKKARDALKEDEQRSVHEAPKGSDNPRDNPPNPC